MKDVLAFFLCARAGESLGTRLLYVCMVTKRSTTCLVLQMTGQAEFSPAAADDVAADDVAADSSNKMEAELDTVRRPYILPS